MGQGRTSRRFIARETLLALLVLALVSLNFGHAAISLGGELKLTAEIWCGDPLLPDQPGHAPCHACRIGGSADLPPAPICVEPVAFTAMAVAYGIREPRLMLAQPRLPANPRAPPIV